MQQASAPHPLTVRTLDAGGDKLLDGIPHMTELNPALGMRAIRLSLSMPQEFKKQLRAILRISALGTVRIMFPMISGLDELRRARTLLDECMSELALAYAPQGVRVVGLNPGLTNTSRVAEGMQAEAQRAGVSEAEALQRLQHHELPIRRCECAEERRHGEGRHRDL